MNDGDRIEHHRGGIRFLLLSLGVPQGLIGLWALLAPRSFYDDFPVVRDGWVNALGPFDEHLVTDVGALFVGLFVLLAIAAVTLHRTTVVAAAVTWLVFNVPHLIWHSFHLEPYGTVDAIANTVAIAGTVAGGVTVLLLARRRPPRRRAAPAGDGDARIGVVSDKDAGLLARGTFAYDRRQFGVVPEPTRV